MTWAYDYMSEIMVPILNYISKVSTYVMMINTAIILIDSVDNDIVNKLRK